MKSLLILIVFGSRCFPLLAQTSTPSNLSAASDVALTQLLASPEKYDGQLVRVTGYLNLAYEAHALYAQPDDGLKRRLKNGLWVDFSAALSREKKLADYNQTYVAVVGVFSATSKGHLGLFGGSLKNIIRLDKPLPGR